MLIVSQNRCAIFNTSTMGSIYLYQPETNISGKMRDFVSENAVLVKYNEDTLGKYPDLKSGMDVVSKIAKAFSASRRTFYMPKEMKQEEEIR